MRKGITWLLQTFFYKMSLMKKLLISYSLLIIVPMSIFTMLSYRHVSETLIDQFQYSSNLSLQQANLYLDQIMVDIENSTMQASFNNPVTDIFQENSGEKSMQTIYKDYLDASKMIKDLFDSDILYSVEIYVKGSPLYVLEESEGKSGISFIDIDSYQGRELAKMMSDSFGKMLWLAPRQIKNLLTQAETPVITGTKYMKSNINLQNIGIIAVNLRQDSLRSIISRSSILPDSISLLLDSNGTILSVSDEELFHQYALSPETINSNLATAQTTFSVDNRIMLLNSTKISSTNWTLVSVIPYKAMLQTSISTRNRMIITMLCVSGLFYLTAYAISKLLSMRLSSLAARMKDVQFDNYVPIPANDGSDEISELINSYNHMLNKINDYAKSQYELGIKLKNSELRALQAQINPHFLYNTLDLLHWLASEYHADEISEIVSLLSQFYKLSLSKGMEIVSVKDALKHIEVYVKLQNYRFNNTIQLYIDVDEQIYEYGILKLILQPIVENSILHGILEKEVQSGVITITCNVIDNVLNFEIMDDGIGMSEADISSIMTSHHPSSNGYGIKNVIDRIMLYYGKEYGLTYHSIPGKGTSVLLQIPCINIESEI